MVTALYHSFNWRKSILRTITNETDGYIMTCPQSIISVEPLPKRAQGGWVGGGLKIQMAHAIPFWKLQKVWAVF